MKKLAAVLAMILSLMVARAETAASWTEKAVWPESPQAAAIRQATAPQPALLTGAAEFSVPLHVLSAEGLNLDFSFNYRSNGIRVDDEPCPWGYGWSLSPSIRISRRIIGRPDGFYTSVAEEPENRFGHNECYHCLTDSGLDKAAIIKMPDFYRDPAPDIFTVQLPGKQFTFIYCDGKFVTVDCSEYRIEADPLFQAITITDPMGFVYNFDVQGEYCETAQSLTEWLPSSIICPSGRKIYFEYVDCDQHQKNIPQRTPPCYSYVSYDPMVSFDPTNKYDGTVQFTHPKFEGGKHLKSVRFEGEKVEISYAVDPKSHLRSVKSLDVYMLSSQIKHYGFTCKDFKLLTAIATPVGYYRFEYNPLEFNEGSSRDWWGFYNGPHFGLLSPRMTVKNVLYGDVRFEDGSDRSVNVTYMQARMLTAAVYPTGGRVEWEYEPHRFDMPEQDVDNSLYVENVPLTMGGGLRVRTVKLYNGPNDKDPQLTEYVYGSGGDGKAVCTRVPTLDSFLDVRTYISYQQPIPPEFQYLVETTKLCILADSKYMSTCIGETPIWYSTVEEITDEGKTTYEFKDFCSRDCEVGITLLNNAPHKLNNAFAGGPQMVEKTVYKKDASGYSPVLRESYDYSTLALRTYYGYTIGRHLNCTVGVSIPDFTGYMYFNMREEIGNGLLSTREVVDFAERQAYSAIRFEILPQREVLLSRTTTEYTENGELKQQQTFEYVEGTGLPSAETLLSIPGQAPEKPSESLRREFRYPSASSADRVERAMAAAGVIGMATGEKVVYNDATVVTDAVMVNPAESVFRPTTLRVSRNGGAIAHAAVYDWDSNGNLLAVTDNAGVSTVYKWDSRGRYPTRKSTGSLVTKASWKDGIGIVELTTPDDMVNRYSYDSAGRLTEHSIDGYGPISRWKYSIDGNGVNNYIMTTTMNSATGSDNPYSIARYDALGRPTVELSAFRGALGAMYRTATATAYDAMGRPVRSYAAAPVDSDNPTVDDVAAASAAFHSDSEPYSATVYEASQRQMATASMKAGADWHADGRAATVRRLTNTASGAYSCKRLSVSSTSGIDFNGTWRKGSLSVQESVDEDGITETVFTDMRGNCVMRRRGEAETYYVYNDYGDLCHILPPGLLPGWYYSTDAKLMQLGYSYTYDERGRLASARWPGRPASHYRYDTANRLVAENDADLDGRWRLHFYDYAGREVLLLETSTHADNIVGLETACIVKTSPSGRYAGYELPSSVKMPADAEVLRADYYDDYSFLDALPDKDYYSYTPQPGANIVDEPLQEPMGFLTGRYTAPDGYEAYHYDWCGRELLRMGSGYDAGRLSRRYDYAGRVVEERREFPAKYGLPDMVTTTTYDAGGRPLKSEVLMDSTFTSATTGIASCAYSYDAIGRLSAANCGGTVGRRLTYDIHGWPTRLSTHYNKSLSGRFANDSIVERLMYADGTVPRYNGFISSRELSGARYDYSYDEMGRLTKASYSSGGLFLGSRPDYSTAYDYDLRGNITALQRYGVTDLVPGMRGSVTPVYGLLDDLTADYTGNRLVEVSVGETGATTFAGRAGACARPGAYDLRWDDAGRLNYDELRDIVDIRYNSLGLPLSMRHGWGDLQTWDYDGLGHKTSASYTDVRSATTERRRYYASGLVALNDTMELIRFPGGYFDRHLRAHYYVADYQGNNIAVFAHGKFSGPEQRTDYYPYGEPHSRPTATDFSAAGNRYLYADKEYSDFGGESTLDFHARTLAPAGIPIFQSMDSHCGNTPDISPYSYCAGNPVMNVDPTGRDTYTLDSLGYVVSLVRNSEYDRIVVMKANGTQAVKQWDYGTIQNVYGINLIYKDGRKERACSFFKVNGDDNGKAIFEFLAQNYSAKSTPIEWALYQVGEEGDNALNYVSTSNEHSTDGSSAAIFNYILKGKKNWFGKWDGTKIRRHVHSHPDNIAFPSKKPNGGGDIYFAKYVYKFTRYNIIHEIYLPDKHEYIQYSRHSLKSEFPGYGK